MFKFGSKSSRNLSTVHGKLQDIFFEVIKEYDCSILCGLRTQEDQDEAFHTGRSTKQWPDSKHNQSPSIAVDVAPYPIDWDDGKRFYHFAGYVKAVADSMGIRIRWGGDWDDDNDLNDQQFFDLVHFELELEETKGELKCVI